MQQTDRSASPRHRRRHDPSRSARGRHASPRESRRDANGKRYQESPSFDDDDVNHTDSAANTPQSTRRSRRRPITANGSSGNHPNGVSFGAGSNAGAANSSTNGTSRGDAGADIEQASADLDCAAQKAVDCGDEVTLALLITSWASSLEEAASHGSTGIVAFENVFHGSRALDIVADGVLQKDFGSESGVRKALATLLGFVLYGGRVLHSRFAELVVQLNCSLKHTSEATERCIQGRKIAVRKVLAVLRQIYADIRAYEEVLPSPADKLSKPNSPSRVPVQPNAGPAGPDPTKAVERSVDAWRRSMARLQGEMAMIVVLVNALGTVESKLRCDGDSSLEEQGQFYGAMRETIKAHISQDIKARKDLLNSQYWVDITTGADSTVFEAVRSRADLWLTQFEASRSEVESQLDDAGIGFGPSARVPEDKFSVLVSASARVAALVSYHQHAFSWAKDVADLLNSMVIAFQCLQTVNKGDLSAPEKLKNNFFLGVEDAFACISNVVNWSFTSLHEKVLGSLEKSIAGGSQKETVQPQKSLRFEEPPKSPTKNEVVADAEASQPQSRRKPRHARMKSSPDALLHLNDHFDGYSDSETSPEVEGSENRESEIPSQIPLPADNAKAGENGTQSEEASDSTESWVRGQEELPIVYEEQPLNYDEEEEKEDPNDREIIVHDDALEDSVKPKKVSHTSHVRSMSVDGIPF